MIRGIGHNLQDLVLQVIAAGTEIGPFGTLDKRKVFQMELKSRPPAFLWSPFVIVSLLTFLVHETAWAVGPYWKLLSLGGVLSSILAVRIVAHTGLRLRPVVFVVIGLIVGQWWFIEFMTAQLLWSIRGFAP